MKRLIVAAALLVACSFTVLRALEFSNAQAIQTTGPGGIFSGRITGLTNRGSDAGAANGLSTAVGFVPAVETLSPNRVCTAMNFAVQVDVSPGNSRTRAFSLVINGLQSSLITCTISGPSSLTCNSGSGTEIIPPRATLAIVETTGGPGLSVSGTAAAFGWECNSATVAAPVIPATDSAGGPAAEVTECKNTLRSGRVSWGGGTTWTSNNIDNLCNGTRNARNTISCFQSNVGALGWAAAIDRCR